MSEFLANRFNYGFFQGEALWIGNLGHFFLILSFVMVALASFSFFKAEWVKNKDMSNLWQKIAKYAFYIHGASIFGVFALLFYMILNHHYEYHYAWSHSSNDLPIYYIISAFWEGQEGSFLLWQFWHVILGLVLIRIAKDYLNPVMSVLSFAQMLLATMVLGVYIFSYKVGVNPFTLLRNAMAGAPIFAQPDYLKFVVDGTGLNLLLQNYWMVIHPPILFLGFAATVVPFSYAIASLWRADYTTWLKPALAWSLFTVGILGTGIFMGGAWAYESLSFGGFWAWDPVENASLVPWLLIVAGVHTLVAYKYTQRGLGISYLFLIFSFIFILYSTFLTRSGVLGNTSVHSFTDLGMTGQLLIYMAFLTLPALILLVFRLKSLPKIEGEEAFLSREFWMFIGALIFLISAIQISWDTSLPVVNLLFDSNLALGTDVVPHYNKVQIIIGIFMALGAASIQYLSYQRALFSKYIKYLGLSFGLALISSILLGFAFKFPFLIDYSLGEKGIRFISTYWILLFASMFAIYSNIAYILTIAKKKLWQWTGSISHIGFGIFLLGILISQGRQEVISINNLGMGLGQGFENEEENQSNIFLIQGDTAVMGDYTVSFEGRIPDGKRELFEVKYLRKDEYGMVKEDFSLFPNAQVNESMGLVSNPDTKHYLLKDVFTHVTSIPEKPKEVEDQIIEMQKGDTLFTSKHFVVLENLVSNPSNEEFQFNDTLMGLGAELSIVGFDGYEKQHIPLYVIDINSGKITAPEIKDFKASLAFQVLNFDPKTETMTLKVKDSNGAEDFITMKAIIFPYINLLWIGGIIMLLGAFLSSIKRYFNKV